MPITTRMAKSGVKKVFKKQRTNVNGRLNRAARQVSTSEAANLTPGAITEPLDQRQNRQAQKKQSAIIENRRRRH